MESGKPFWHELSLNIPGNLPMNLLRSSMSAKISGAQKVGFIHIVFVLLDHFIKNFGSYINRIQHDPVIFCSKIILHLFDHKGLSQILQRFDQRSMRATLWYL